MNNLDFIDLEKSCQTLSGLIYVSPSIAVQSLSEHSKVPIDYLFRLHEKGLLHINQCCFGNVTDFVFDSEEALNLDYNNYSLN